MVNLVDAGVLHRPERIWVLRLDLVDKDAGMIELIHVPPQGSEQNDEGSSIHVEVNGPVPHRVYLARCLGDQIIFGRLVDEIHAVLLDGEDIAS